MNDFFDWADKLGIADADIARGLNCAHITVRRWRNGKFTPHALFIEKLNIYRELVEKNKKIPRISLDDWMKKENITITELARLLECPYLTVSRWRKNLSTPSLYYIKKLRELTNDEVKV